MKANFLNNIKITLKERWRKFLVAIKRHPDYFPLVALAVTFIYYSFNLTYISKTTALINSTHMGLASFVTMLFSILSFLCLLNAFPKRQKPNIFMLVVFAVMTGAIIFFDVYYHGMITKSTIEINEQRAFVNVAKKIVTNHVVLTVITAVLTALEPIIAKLLKKINTSLEIEYTESIDSIDITDEE